MRYIIKSESVLGHGCCFEATVLDTHDKGEHTYKDGRVVCECLTIEDASLIADVLNERYEAKHGHRG